MVSETNYKNQLKFAFPQMPSQKQLQCNSQNYYPGLEMDAILDKEFLEKSS